MGEVFENIHTCNRKDLEEFFRYKMEMELERNTKDVKKRYNKQYS